VKANNSITKMLLLCTLVLMLGGILRAQTVLNSEIREDVEIWEYLESPNYIGNGDNPWTEISMPFPFTYNNQNITRVFIYGNGYLTFNVEGEPSGLEVPRLPNVFQGVAWYSRDLFTNTSLSYKVTGQAPFRILTIEHLGARVVTDQSGKTFDAQVKIYETSNEVKIIYNKVSGLGGAGVDGYLYFAGTGNQFINIKPNQPLEASTFYYSNQNINNSPWLNKDAIVKIPQGKSYTLTSLPTFGGIYPPNNAVLATGEVYTEDEHPYVRINRAPGQKAIKITYQIRGPLNTPEEKVIYTAVNTEDVNGSTEVIPNPQPQGTRIRVKMPHAIDIAGRLSDGALDLETNADQLPSGEYRVTATLEFVDGTPYFKQITSLFTIAFPSDIAITDMEEPTDNIASIYTTSSLVPIKIDLKNQGSDPVDYFDYTYEIRDEDGDLVGNYSGSFELEDPLQYNEERLFNLDPWDPSQHGIGNYTVRVTVNLRNPGDDELRVNNTFPREGDNAKAFIVGYGIEAESDAMISPPATWYVKRPFRPGVRFQNNGFQDLSFPPAYFLIRDPNGTIVYNDTIIIQDLPAGIVNQVEVFWNSMFTPQIPGTYDVTIDILQIDDEEPANNQLNTTFVVEAGLAGEYTIDPNGGDYPTFQAAVDDLYFKGVSGNVEFLVAAGTYMVGDETLDAPALDISSKIIGTEDYTVTFKPNPVDANRASSQIILKSAGGIGILLGQNQRPNNVNAVVNNVFESNVREFANSDGNIIFDGGPKKSFRFSLMTGNDFRAVFYLKNGASNVTIKNSIITDGISQQPNYECLVPLSVYNTVQQEFIYEANDNGLGTFTTGILMRSTPPVEEAIQRNIFFMDTLTNMNNTFANNEISNFAYGIMGMGVGGLFIEGEQLFDFYYNGDNSIYQNEIFDCGRAGVFLGFEKGTDVVENRIYDIHGMCNGDAAGIIAGGMSRGNLFGYHNVDLKISANEISHIRANNNITAIKVENSRIDFQSTELTQRFPNVDESTLILNNIIWGLAPNNAGTNVIGVLMMTERANGLNWAGLDFTPKYGEYHSRNDLVVNNTVLVTDDNWENTGVQIGIALLNTDNAKLYNNAFAVNDQLTNTNSTVTSSVFYFGTHPSMGGIISDRNAYWIENNEASVFRFIEIDGNSNVLEQGFKNEFVNLEQWRQWTDQDARSIIGNFVEDYEETGNAPYNLRVKKSPYPRGSVLNNRGISVEVNELDIDGQERGSAGELYDIGADEFRGRLFGRDFEVVSIQEPGSYRATAPAPFNDAEYVMTQAPVPVIATIRNTGLLPMSDRQVILSVKREMPDGTFAEEFNVTAAVDDLTFSEFKQIDFRLNDGINTPPNNPEFFPQTYGDLINDGYNVPDQFKKMIANVTPIYRIEILVPTDENGGNNVRSKDVRFYLRKSPLGILASAEDYDVNGITDQSPVHQIAANLNLDSLEAAFIRHGYIINLNLEDPRTDYDVFDRKKWEPRSIDYTLYRYLFWVDGHDMAPDANNNMVPNVPTRYERENITEFLESGTFDVNKFLAFGSQEMVRNNYADNMEWVQKTLFAKPGEDYDNPLGPMGNYDGNNITGINIGRNEKFPVSSTQFAGDTYPEAGLIEIDNAFNLGTSLIGLVYDNHIDITPENPEVTQNERIAAIRTIFPRYNVATVGLDWRHWQDTEHTVRALFDFFTWNTIPVEILSFDAVAAGKRVDLAWKTASELNSSHFEIERAEVNGADKTNFTAVENIEAAGESNLIRSYGPVSDYSVEFGKTYAYRLKMVDRDGTFEYSSERLVTIYGNNGSIAVGEIAPNPADAEAKFTIELGEAMPVTVKVYDINGTEMLVPFQSTNANGSNLVEIATGKLTSGSYTVVVDAAGSVITRKLNVIR
jgi:hypothetical protein